MCIWCTFQKPTIESWPTSENWLVTEQDFFDIRCRLFFHAQNRSREYMQTLSVSNLLNLFHHHSDSICRALHDKDPATWNTAFPNNQQQINYSASTTTGMLWGHIAKWRLVEYLKIASNPNRQWWIQLSNVGVAIGLGYTFNELKEIAKKDGKLNNLPPHSTNSTTPDNTASKNRADILPFSLPQLHKHLIDFIVADDQSLNILECKEFQCLLLFLREDTNIPHRTKIKIDIIEAWKDYFVGLKQDLTVHILSFIGLISLIVSLNCAQNAVRDVSFTADIWSSDARWPYLALTAHWIAEDSKTASLSLCSALIAFHCLRGNHTGESLGCTILYLLDCAGIMTKTSHFTLDNAENNVKMMENLEKLLVMCELPLEFDAKDRWIMCFPHIINICVQYVVDKFSAPDLKKIARAWVDCCNRLIFFSYLICD